MKSAFILTGVIGILVLATISLHVFTHLDTGHFLHSTSEGNQSVTIRLNHAGNFVCGQPFFDATYEFAKETFAVGVENVVLSEFEEKTFNFIRTNESFKGNREAYIDHVKDIPRQLIEIVKEDPTVLDSCANFQIAMIGPP